MSIGNAKVKVNVLLQHSIAACDRARSEEHSLRVIDTIGENS
jgi:hypothetical protein